MPDDNSTPIPTATPVPESQGGLQVQHGSQPDDLATAEEFAAFQVRLLRLLERRTAIYTMGDSTSVPTHVAADLLRSVCFVLGIDPDDPEIPRWMLNVDLEEEYRRRLAEIGRRVEAAEALWRDVIATMPLIENVALRDTLEGIGSFFKHYDYRSMAHETEVMIDYPLCHPVPETLLGIDYIEEFLRRLMIEADFLQRFELERIERVLSKASPDYRDLLINLYEPVATNALGLALIGRDPRALLIAEGEREAIDERLRPLGAAGRERVLREAADGVGKKLGIDDESAVTYLGDLVPELLPRIAVGLSHEGLGGVFV